MTELALFALLGLAVGSLYAGLGMGIVVTFRTTGVVNIAQVGLGMWGAFAADELASTGRLVLPWVGPASAVGLGGPWPGWAALAAGVVSAAVLGAAAHLLIFRPLRSAPQLARIVATVGLLLTLQALIGLQFGTGTRRPESLLPDGVWSVQGLDVPADRFVLAGLTLAIAAVLVIAQRRTLVGLALRATAEDETSVALAGWSPNLLAALGWAIAGAVSATLASLAAPSLGLSPTTFPALLVPGLACALVGRLSSIGVAAVAGLVLGSVQSVVVYLTSQPSWPDWARTGLGDAFPLVVVVLVLMLMGRSLPERGAIVTDRLPPAPRGPLSWPLAASAVTGALALLVLTSGTVRFAVITSMIFVLFTLSVVVVTGLVGQVSLAQAAVAGVAAFTVARVTPDVPFPLNLVVGVIVGTVIGTAIGVPALRIRHGQLAVVTLAAAVAVDAFVFRNSALNAVGQGALPAPRLWGADFSVRRGDDLARWPFGLLVLTIVVAACVGVAVMSRGSLGRRFLAVRGDERAAAAAGIDVARTKLLAFAISSALASLGGVLVAYSYGQVSAEPFGVMVGVTFLLFAYIGGVTSVTGALVAAAFAPGGLAFLLLDGVVDLGEWFPFVSGLALLVVIVAYPQGNAGALAKVSARLAALRGIGPVEVGPASAGTGDVHGAERVAGEPLLDVDGLTVRYGGVLAVDSVSFRLRSGEVLGLIGANGAGKSSVVDALTGFARSTGGIRLHDREISGHGPRDRYRSGLARTWQSTALFLDLSVRENIDAATVTSSRRARTESAPSSSDPGDQALIDSGSWPLQHHMPDELSTGQQRIVGLARALAGRPSVLLADEPAAGLEPAERIALADRLRSIAARGAGIVLIEHDLELVMRTCDRVIVMDRGQVIAEGSPEAVRSDPAVIAAYLGATPETAVLGGGAP
ncbi:ABC transporter permease subunit [Aeromicrobium endophyticum]|uniref:ATP-binding cassette domain-containing protein n=1 Tax=Aeromicrobium endophyticum TaxID=2292704 RepID=A0A371PBD8_9ACTN|nr:ATP-binding cassette domain-containing protein [Aeromicrobium endophyticum]REK72886.1 ATP-binding cassette domain-containing protein [Aeromicrobium endophyticum]